MRESIIAKLTSPFSFSFATRRVPALEAATKSNNGRMHSAMEIAEPNMLNAKVFAEYDRNYSFHFIQIKDHLRTSVCIPVVPHT